MVGTDRSQLQFLVDSHKRAGRFKTVKGVYLLHTVVVAALAEQFIGVQFI